MQLTYGVPWAFGQMGRRGALVALLLILAVAVAVAGAQAPPASASPQSDETTPSDGNPDAPNESQPPSPPARAPENSDWHGRAVVERVIDELGQRETLDRLVGHFQRYLTLFEQRIPERMGGSRITSVARRMFADPLGQVGEARAITDRLLAARTGGRHDVPAIVATLAHALDAPIGPVDAQSLGLPAVPEAGSDAAAWLDYLQAVLERAAAERERAFAELSETELHMLVDNVPQLFDTLQRSVYMELQPPSEYKRMQEWLALAAKVDFAALFRGGAVIARLADTALLDRIREDLAAAPVSPELTYSGITGSLIAMRSTPFGQLLIGGPQANTYGNSVRGFDLTVSNIALIVDVGGNDAYLGDSLTSINYPDPVDYLIEPWRPLPIKVVLDLAGSNTFSAPDTSRYAPRLGGAFGGYTLLCARCGTNTYLGGTTSMGVGCFGVGLLVDFEGDDRYVGQSFSMGTGCFGIGLLYDGAGSNHLTGTTHSGGFGLPGGAGLLYLGGREGDRVCITGRNADPPIGSTYGTANTWNGMCLGCGLGLRSIPGRGNPDLAGGGIGIALSGGGDDVFEAGEFGMGIGYFFGLGIFRNAAGNDRYRAGRYGIATGAHQALGVFLDDAGHDEYRVSSVAAVAGNWDTMVCSFVDAAGDDTYRIESGLGLGSATITSFALFFDGGGRDRYSAIGRNTLGAAGHASDAARGTQSLGVFVDLGGDPDDYQRGNRDDPSRADGLQNVQAAEHEGAVTGYGVFHDDGPLPPDAGAAAGAATESEADTDANAE